MRVSEQRIDILFFLSERCRLQRREPTRTDFGPF